MITAIRDTNNILAVRRVIDIASKIDVLEPDSSPLTQLATKIGKRPTKNPKFNWMEEESLVKTGIVNGAVTSGATVIAVDTGHGARFRAGDVVRNTTTNEQMLVSSVSTDNVTLSRGWGSTAAATVTDNDVLLIVGNANQEHATKRAFKIGDQSEKTNYTQIFRTPFGISETANQSELYGGNDLKHQRMMQLIEHQKEIERAMWWGEPKLDTSGSQPRRATGGVDYWVSTNSTDASTTLTESEFDTWLRTGFRYGSTTKWLFASPIITQAISMWAKGKLQTVSRDKTYGIAIQQYLTPFGVVNIVNMNLFSETTVYAGYAYLIDPKQLTKRPMTNRDTKLKTNIQDNSADGEEDEYITEVGLEFTQEKKASVLYNVTDFS